MEGTDARTDDGTDLISRLDSIKCTVLNYSDKAITQYSASNLQDQTKELWAELKPQISINIDKEFKQLLVEYKTIEKVAKLLQLRKEHCDLGQPPAWSYSGNPVEDVTALRNVTAKELEANFEKVLLEAQTTSNELYSVYKQLQDNITVLDEQIKTVSEEIRTITDKLSHDTTNGPS